MNKNSQATLKKILSTEKILKKYKTSYEELLHLYQINKEIFKINLSNLNESSTQQIIHSLTLENDYLYQLLIQQHTHQCSPIPPIQPSSDISSSTQSLLNDKRLFNQLKQLEQEIKTLKSTAPKTTVFSDPHTFQLCNDSLQSQQINKRLRDQLIQTETKLEKVNRLKNDLIRDRFVL